MVKLACQVNYGLHLHHENNYLLIDSGDGLSERIQANNRNHIGSIGGTGFFFDGHFIFYPAGNRLWLRDQECLRTSYNQLTKMFHEFLNIPSFPCDLSAKSVGQVTTVRNVLDCHADMAPDMETSLAAWFGNVQHNNEEQNTINAEKRQLTKQSTFQLNLEQRKVLIALILQFIKPNQLSLNTKLCWIESITDHNYISHYKKNGNDIVFRCKNLIFCGDRFSNISYDKTYFYKQVKVGVHICRPVNSSLFPKGKQNKSKVMAAGDINLEYRTFFGVVTEIVNGLNKME